MQTKAEQTVVLFLVFFVRSFASALQIFVKHKQKEILNFKTCSVWVYDVCAGVVAVSNLTWKVSEGKQARCPNYCKTKEEYVYTAIYF